MTIGWTPLAIGRGIWRRLPCYWRRNSWVFSCASGSWKPRSSLVAPQYPGQCSVGHVCHESKVAQTAASFGIGRSPVSQRKNTYGMPLANATCQ